MPAKSSIRYPSSGKGAKDENFPVASILLPARHRAEVMTFYRFARAADDIADSPRLSPDEKQRALTDFLETLHNGSGTHTTPRVALAMRESLTRTGVSSNHCEALLLAFLQDASKQRYASWQELMDYCMLSAAPVGYYLIDLHGGPTTAYPASAALCSALQVLNHLQDCKDDYIILDRIYLPQEWLHEAGVPLTALRAPHTTDRLRKVFTQCLARIDALLQQAAALSGQVSSPRLAMNTSVILAIARRLALDLTRRDPLAERVTLRFGAYAGCMVRGLLHAAGARRRPGDTLGKRRLADR